MFLPDMRDMGRKTFPEMQTIMHLLTHFSPMAQQRVNMKGPPSDDVAMPVKLRNYSSDFRRLGGPETEPSHGKLRR